MYMHKYNVVKVFTAGPLRGMRIEERYSFYIRPGNYTACIGSSKYRIVSCVPAKQVA